MPEVQVLGSLADESLEWIIRRAHEEARAKGRDELKQARSQLRLSGRLGPT